MNTAWIGLGSNLGHPRRQVETALCELAGIAQSRCVARSHLYRSRPWGLAGQPDFVNAVARLETSLEPQALLEALQAIERDHGRQRNGPRWGPRTLDLDLLVYGDRVIRGPGLVVPHPHLAERAFVLLPLAELAPQLEVPGAGPVATLLAGVDASDCRRLAAAAAETRS